MDFIRWSMDRPVSVTVGVLLIVLAGLVGLGAIPIQLTPTADQPTITVTTNWPGRSPQEIVDEITQEQEKRLKNVPNLKSMRSTSREGSSEVTLEFILGSDINRALQEVSDALRQVPQYPDEVDEPFIKAAEGSAQNAIAWIIIDVDPASAARHPDYDVSTLFDALDREVKPYLERIDGVAEINIYGGREREVRVLVDPVALSQRGLTHGDVITALRGQNRNVSAGTIAEGKRDFRVRVVGQYEDPAEILETIVAYRDGRPVYISDIGTAEMGHVKARGFVRSMGVPCLAMNVIRQSGANVISVMADVRERLDAVRADLLPKLDPVAGPDLRMRQVYDETTYIDSAIDLVVGNLRVGGLLSVLILLVFLRSVRYTLVIALTIPVCLIATFLVLLAAGRTLNVISLAGLAFATGVVVDNAVVVLENIARRRQLGDVGLVAVYRGTKEVWAAILGGTLTSIAVMIPILTIQEEAGQLFFDLTLALAVSTGLSLIMALTVVPSGMAVLARLADARASKGTPRPAKRLSWKNAWGLDDVFGRFNAALARGVYWLNTGWRGWTLRPALIVLMCAASLLGAKFLAPPLDYLPGGNQNLVFGGLLVPPGLSQDEQLRYANVIEDRVAPYTAARLDDPASLAALAPIPRFDASGDVFEPVPIEQFFIGAFQGGMFVGATSQDPQRVIPVGNLVTTSMNGMPDAYGGAAQTSIFGRGVGSGGNKIELEISGPSLDRVVAAAGALTGQLFANPKYGPRSIQPNPSNFNLTQPEWRVHVTQAGRELGLRNEDLGLAVRALFDGAYAGDFQDAGRTVDINVLPSGGRLDTKEDLATIPVMTPSGFVVPIGTVAEVVPSRAPQEIRRIEELPSVSISITPPAGEPLEAVMNELRTAYLAPLESAGVIDSSMRVRLEGSAAKLDEVRASLLGRPSDPDAPETWWQRALRIGSYVIGAAGLVVGIFAGVKASRRRDGRVAYGAAGALLFAVLVGGIFFGIAAQPGLLLARFVWAVLVTYLLMAALFESFLYPFVILFSVPLGIVGGFAALRLVHDWTLRNPESAPQQLDVLTMIGFVILIGTVVNNAILLVEQARNFMGEGAGSEGDQRLDMQHAIAESVRTRIRPIMMTTLTTVAGGLPLVIAPGAGSEMYRGLGAVVIGGLMVSTVFTLVLVPLVFSLTLQMSRGLRVTFGLSSPDDLPHAAAPVGRAALAAAPVHGAANGANGTHSDRAH